MKKCTIKSYWDAPVWCAEVAEKEFSLVMEAESLDALVERVKIAVQDICETDLHYTGAIQFHLQAERIDNVMAKAS